jgi:hypothetical protein
VFAFAFSHLTSHVFCPSQILRKSKSSSPVKAKGFPTAEPLCTTFVITDDVVQKYRRLEKQSLARPLIHIGHGKMYGQAINSSRSATPSRPTATRLSRREFNTAEDNPQSGYDDEGFSLSFAPSTPLLSPQKTRSKRSRQWAHWRDSVIPSLINPYLKYLASSQKPLRGTTSDRSCG